MTYLWDHLNRATRFRLRADSARRLLKSPRAWRLNVSEERREAFLQACAAGDLTGIRAMISEGMPVNFLMVTTYPWGSTRQSAATTPLLVALTNYQEQVAVELVKAGALSIPDSEGHEPLTIATQADYSSALRAMLEAGFSPEPERDPALPSPLIYAIKGRDFHLADMLLEFGAKPGGRRLFMKHTAVSYALEYGVEQVLDWVHSRFPDPRPHLPDAWSIGALTAHHIDHIVGLHRKGYDVLAPSRNGTDVLAQVQILQVGRVASARACATLIALGADVQCHETDMQELLGPQFANRLLQAAYVGSPYLIQVALEAGADPDQIIEPEGLTVVQMLEQHLDDRALDRYEQWHQHDARGCAEAITRFRHVANGPGGETCQSL